MKRRFVDTNVVLYSVSTLAVNKPKMQIARRILAEPDLAFSVQVLQEFYTQAIRPTRVDALTHQQATHAIVEMRRHPIQPMTEEIFDAALVTKQRYQVSYWDAAIIEAARAIGCSTVVSEDLDDGAIYGGIRVENPFARLE